LTWRCWSRRPITEIVDPGVVADDGQVFRALAADGDDEILRDAAEAEAAHEDGGTVGEFGDGGVGGGDAFVHTSVPGVQFTSSGEKQEGTTIPEQGDS